MVNDVLASPGVVQSAWRWIADCIDIFVLCVFRCFLEVLEETFRRDTCRKTPLDERSARDLLPETESVQSIRMLTYNVFLRPPGVNNNWDRGYDDKKNERCEGIIRDVLPHYDIIAFQELFAGYNTRQRRIIRAARRLGYRYVRTSRYSPLTTRMFWRLPFVDAGLVILSRFPIVESDHWVYSAGNQIDKRVAKQVLFARVQVTARHQINLFTSHMQASYVENPVAINKVSDDARLVQLRELGEFMRRKAYVDCSKPEAGGGARSNARHVVLFAGDTNADARHEPLGNVHFDEQMAGKPRNQWHLAPETGPSSEYRRCLATVQKPLERFGKLHDLLWDTFGYHPCTYAGVFHEGKGRVRAREPHLTHSPDHGSAMSVDYVLVQDDYDRRLYHMPADHEHVHVVPFRDVGHQHGYEQLSDHDAIEFQIQLLPAPAT